MKQSRTTGLWLLPLIFLSLMAFRKKETGPWKEKQLVRPEILAERIRNGDTANLILLNTGPVEDIAGAVTIGAVEDPAHLAQLRTYLQSVPKDKEIIIYCGCCPISLCPNLRPAWEVLQQEHFRNYKVLRLVHDLQEDWIDKGYPTQP